jgi:hypothetical protein
MPPTRESLAFCDGCGKEGPVWRIGNECGENIKHVVVAYSNYLHERLAEMIWNDWFCQTGPKFNCSNSSGDAKAGLAR